MSYDILEQGNKCVKLYVSSYFSPKTTYARAKVRHGLASSDGFAVQHRREGFFWFPSARTYVLRGPKIGVYFWTGDFDRFRSSLYGLCFYAYVHLFMYMYMYVSI